MTEIRRESCQACPYRRDCPSGIWSPTDYAKLPPYDALTADQPFEAFLCHATTEFLCHGWAIVGIVKVPHERQLLVARMPGIIDGDLPEERAPLFDSHTEAAAHGLRDINRPSPQARDTMVRLVRKYDRLAEPGGRAVPLEYRDRRKSAPPDPPLIAPGLGFVRVGYDDYVSFTYRGETLHGRARKINRRSMGVQRDLNRRIWTVLPERVVSVIAAEAVTEVDA